MKLPAAASSGVFQQIKMSEIPPLIRPPPSIQIAVFDSSAVLDDRIEGSIFSSRLFSPLMLYSLVRAFQHGSYKAPPQIYDRFREIDSKEVLRAILRDAFGTGIEPYNLERLTSSVYETANCTAVALAKKVEPRKGIRDLFSNLKNKGVYVAIVSEFPDEVTDEVARNLGWGEQVNETDRRNVDLFLTPTSLRGYTRDSVAVINQVLKKSGILPRDFHVTNLATPQHDFNYGTVMNVGADVSGVKRGIDSGAFTVAVPRDRLSRSDIYGTFKESPGLSLIVSSKDLLELSGIEDAMGFEPLRRVSDMRPFPHLV